VEEVQGGWAGAWYPKFQQETAIMSTRSSSPRLWVSRLVGLSVLVFGLGIRAQDAPGVAGRLKGVQAMVEQELAECDDPQEKAAMQRLLFSLFPEELRRAEAALKHNRDEAEEIVGMVIDQAWRLMDLREDQPERYEAEVKLRQLNNQTIELGRKVVAAKGAEREALTKQLRARLAEYFDMKQAQMKQDAERLKAELERVEAQIRIRAERRNSMLDRRLRQLVEGDVEW
jgi:hypothetical protein